MFYFIAEGIQETQQFKFSTEASLELEIKKFFVRAPEKVRNRRAAAVIPPANGAAAGYPHEQ